MTTASFTTASAITGSTTDLNCINDNLELINDRLYKQIIPNGIAKTVSVATVLIPTSISGNGSQITVTISGLNQIPFPVTSQVTITGVGTTTGYNGTYTVSTSSFTSSIATVVFTASITGTATTASSSIYFSTQNRVILSNTTGLVVGRAVEGSGITASATISAINTTSRLITISSPFIDTINAGQYLYFEPNQTASTNTVYECFNLFKRKVIASGLTGNPATDSINQMAQAFETALSASPNSEEVKVVEDPTQAIKLALITENGEVSWNKDDKNIALSLSNAPQIGQTIDWIRTGEKYLIMAQNYTQKAYFSGMMRSCTWLLKWRYNGIIYSQWVVIDGPGENGNGYRKFDGKMIDPGQDSIQLYLGKLPGTEYLSRYDRIILNNRPWKIFVLGNMENTKILKLALQEDQLDSAVDDTTNQITDNTDYAILEFRDLVLGNL